MAAWASVVLPSIAIGGCLLLKDGNEGEEYVCHEEHHQHFYGASPKDFGGNSTLGFGGFPFNPGPGNGGGTSKPGDLVYEGPKYEGPNVANYREQPNFVKDYFRNLKTNFPTNDDDNNCGYVSAAMLLSYYDTCWNSSIVPDVFNNSNKTELNSLSDTFFDAPGVKDYNLQVWTGNYPQKRDEPAETASESVKKEYRDYVYGAYSLYIERMTGSAVKNNYIIPHLYKIALNKGIIRFNDHTPSYDYKSIIPTIDFEGLSTVLSAYFEEIDELKNNKMIFDYVDLDSVGTFSTEAEKYAAVRQAAIEKLKNGQPIIYGGDLKNDKGKKGNGHIAIAYEYDEANDAIYGHIGWKGLANTRVNFDEAFFDFNGFAFFTISDDLRASANNYRFKVGSDEYESFALSSHVHSFSKPIAFGNITKHALQCSCGQVQYEKHTFPLIEKCKICGR